MHNADDDMQNVQQYALTGDFVRAARRNARLTQIELAQRARVSRRTICNIEASGPLEPGWQPWVRDYVMDALIASLQRAAA